jgi:SAM-dependent MidA family methyltransferase
LSKVAEIIAKEIQSKGPIPFARFQELALYCPVYGYYEKEKDTVGTRGDYCTSVSVGSLFGELLAYRFARWLETLEGPVQLVEAGAHDGTLAGDILRWTRRSRGDLFDRLEYWIVEPSQRRRDWQNRTLAEFSGKVRWAKTVVDVESSMASRRAHESAPVHGIIFCNELLDALPVRRFGWDKATQTWFEWGVNLKRDKFVWTRLRISVAPYAGARTGDARASRPPAPQDLPGELLQVLPDGFTIEVNALAQKWWAGAAEVLASGRLVTIDYGLSAEELLVPERLDGTLRAYYRQQPTADILSRPGEQDLTAHVNFSAIREAGEAAGLITESFSSQEQFLVETVASMRMGGNGMGEWAPGQTRQFQTLVHPDHFGRAFRVLVQARGASELDRGVRNKKKSQASGI